MTNEQIEYLKNIVRGKSVKEISELLNNKFHTQFSKSHIAYIKNKYNIRSGPIATFEKGHTPLRYKPIGHERIKNGHVYIKVAEPSVYISKQRYIYEKAHGKIPKGYVVIFKDRDKRNFDLENLMLVSQSEFLIMNDNHLYKDESELTETGVLIAKIIDRTNKLKS